MGKHTLHKADSCGTVLGLRLQTSLSVPDPGLAETGGACSVGILLRVCLFVCLSVSLSVWLPYSQKTYISSHSSTNNKTKMRSQVLFSETFGEDSGKLQAMTDLPLEKTVFASCFQF